MWWEIKSSFHVGCWFQTPQEWPHSKARPERKLSESSSSKASFVLQSFSWPPQSTLSLLMQIIFKVFIEFALFCFVFVMCDLSSTTRDWTCTLCVRRGSIDYWTMEEIPSLPLWPGSPPLPHLTPPPRWANSYAPRRRCGRCTACWTAGSAAASTAGTCPRPAAAPSAPPPRSAPRGSAGRPRRPGNPRWARRPLSPPATWCVPPACAEGRSEWGLAAVILSTTTCRVPPAARCGVGLKITVLN